MEKTCLTVDIGNSSTKWAVWSGDEIVALGRVPALSESTVESITAKYGVIDAVAVSCVGSAERIPAIEGALILSASTPLPIDISEYAPGLGADRIAAMAGAETLEPGSAKMVIDYGTAVTYDRLDAGARFAGGNIAPGITTRFISLRQDTALLPRVETEGALRLSSLSTSEAILSGVMLGILAEYDIYASLCPSVFITGGDAPDFLKYLPASKPVPRYEPNLVHIGLKRIIDYNNNEI